MIDSGINGDPYLWERSSGDKFVLIDIFNPETSERCYSVFVLPANPNSTEETKRTLIGTACADTSDDGWGSVYERALKIAEKYMINH